MLWTVRLRWSQSLTTRKCSTQSLTCESEVGALAEGEHKDRSEVHCMNVCVLRVVMFAFSTPKVLSWMLLEAESQCTTAIRDDATAVSNRQWESAGCITSSLEAADQELHKIALKVFSNERRQTLWAWR